MTGQNKSTKSMDTFVLYQNAGFPIKFIDKTMWNVKRGKEWLLDETFLVRLPCKHGI